MNVALATNVEDHPAPRRKRASLQVVQLVQAEAVNPFVTIEGRALAKTMRLMSAVVEKRNTMPILGMVRLSVAGSELRVTGTDLDIEATTSLDVIDAGGIWSACVDCRTLASIARVASVMPMRLAPGENSVLSISLGDGDASYEIPFLTAKDFPILAGDRGAEIERFGNGQLAVLLDKIVACISTEETRYYLNGVAWQIGSHGRRVVATDGHRMALCRYLGDAMGEISETRIIPRKTVDVLRRFSIALDVAIHAVTSQSDGKIEVVWPGTVIRTKLVEGQYHDVDRVVPKAETLKFHFSLKRTELLAALDRAVAVFARRDGRAIHFKPAGGKVSVGAKSYDYGASSCALSTSWPVDGAEPAPEFGFNASYFRDHLIACQGGVTVHQVSPISPFVITDDDATMTRVLMPMRV